MALIDLVKGLEQLKDHLNQYGSGKEFQLFQREAAKSVLDFMQFQLLPSNYNADDASPNYAVMLKGVAEEAARLLYLSDQVNRDLYFEEVRGEFIVQTVGSYLLDTQRFFDLNLDNVAFRSFLITFMKGFFGGSIASNLEFILATFPGPQTDPVTGQHFFLRLFEINLRAIAAGLNPDIAFQWMFLVKVDRPDLIADLSKFVQNTMFVLFQTKPAHTLPFVDFNFKEPGNILTEQPISARFQDFFRQEHFFYDYDDVRRPYQRIPITIVREDVTASFNFFNNPTRVRVRHRPMVGSTDTLATPADVLIEINPTGTISVVAVDPYTGIVDLASPPPPGAQIWATYKWQGGMNFTSQTNDTRFPLNQSLSEFYGQEPYGVLLNSTPPLSNPLVISYKYSAYELPNSALQNEDQTLALNGDRGAGNLLNRFKVFKSRGYDRDEFNTVLGEGTPPFPWTQSRVLVGQQPYPLGFLLNDTESKQNDPASTMFDHSKPPTRRAQELSRLDDVFGDIQLQRVISDGTPGLTVPLFDMGIRDIGLTYKEDTYSIQPDVECDRVILNNMFSGFLNGTAVINNFTTCPVTFVFAPQPFADAFGAYADELHLVLSTPFTDTFKPYINTATNFMTNTLASITNNTNAPSTMLQEGASKVPDYFITLVFSNPPATKYMDGSGALRATPLPFP